MHVKANITNSKGATAPFLIPIIQSLSLCLKPLRMRYRAFKKIQTIEAIKRRDGYP